jgi:hypothetical protein
MADDDSGASSSSRKKSTSKSTNKSTNKSSGSRSSGTRKSSGASSKKSASSGGSSSRSSSSGRRGSDAPRAEAAPRTSPAKLAATAAQQLLELTGRDTEGVIGLEKGDDGWRVQVEVVEVRRIPNTTDVLALYEIDADDKGNLQGYRRLRRYARGAAGDAG